MIFVINIIFFVNKLLIVIKINHKFIKFSFILYHLNFIMNKLNYYNNYNELLKIISHVLLLFPYLYMYHKLLHVTPHFKLLQKLLLIINAIMLIMLL